VNDMLLASSSKLGPSRWERPQSDKDLKVAKDLGVAEITKWWNGASNEDVLGTEGSSWMAKSGEGSEMDSGSCEFLRRNTW